MVDRTVVLATPTDVKTPWGPLPAVGEVTFDVMEPAPTDPAALLAGGFLKRMTLARDAAVGPLALRAGTVLAIDAATQATSRAPIACGALQLGWDVGIERGDDSHPPRLSGTLQAPASVDGIPLRG